MFNWLFKFFKKSSNVEATETETYQLGKIDLIFMFKDGSSDRRTFKGSIEVQTSYLNYGSYNYYEYTTAENEAFDFIQARQDLGFYAKNQNILVPMSEITEIIVAHHPYSVTVDKL